jgi:hypothetical protein
MFFLAKGMLNPSEELLVSKKDMRKISKDKVDE